MICKVRSLKSRIKKRSILEKIITSRNEVFKDSESDMAVGIKMQCNRTRESIERLVIVQLNAGSEILTVEP